MILYMRLKWMFDQVILKCMLLFDSQIFVWMLFMTREMAVGYVRNIKSHSKKNSVENQFM